ncbi:Fanconi anemia group B protein [Chiloscyllium plagiosum]|uniref:Fanconi anemia group B protein n=1 Tax=Chiloscyllium plagiosum TaxID=36176 RepID=UPI001CB81A94|nr:Fanconi anemia group B protein [Chiloscyllium plagiosum]XP_043556494.1 Fanconi anemia group B protein [Chiloscyllium plagiosum]XP_043556495.1 Fanconi anemia group B protein [Chiloscyllium plagiosum]XP_043556496.1 Fanconi anemia group B protein [Chiloscyllium plagiosum]XP_043556497.1 Fanconi anemia group B protein [Chiloscyllium plagiosum]XP_043556498.1 Fanconi anemia group B protein [Chiloscyllium plagiosum]
MEPESKNKTMDVTTLKGEVIYFIVSKEKQLGGKMDAVLQFNRMTFDSETGKFKQKFSGKFILKQKSSSLQIVACCCAIDSRTGQNAPCILLEKHRKAHSKFRYSLLMLHSSNQVEQCLDFELDYELKVNVTLLTGPSVLWSCGNQVYYISSETNGFFKIPISFTAVKWIGEISDGDIIVLGVRKTIEPVKTDEISISHADKLIWGCEFVTYSLQKRENFCISHHFIPHAYSCVVTSILICPSEEIDDQIKTIVVATTCKKQLVLFENCVPKNVCQLPFDESHKIKVVTTGRENCFFLVSSKAGRVCAVSKESWQVVAVWQEIWTVQLDDFLGIGTEQILLLPSAACTIEDCFKSFVLTDLGEFNHNVNSGHAEDNGTQPYDKGHVNYYHTVQALEARLQLGLASLEELQQLLRAKERVLLQSTKALTSLIEGKQSTLPQAEEEGLVSLWNEEQLDLRPLVEQACPTSQVLNYPVQKIWQRIVDSSWIVGIQLSESVSLNFDYLSLSLVMDHDFTAAPVIQSQSKVLKVSRSPVLASFHQYPSEPPLKKPRLEMQDIHALRSSHKEDPCFRTYKDHTQTITVVTDLSPLLIYNNIHCCVLLHGTMGPIQKTESTNREKIISCGRVSLNLEDIWNEKYAINLLQNPLLCTGNAVEDFYGTVAASRRSSFRIFSPDYTLTRVKDWLLGSMQCDPLKICPEYLLCSKSGPLQGILLNWHPQNPFQGILTVLCRNQSFLLMFLHGLIKILPQGCVVTHVSAGTEDQIADMLGCALEQECLAFRNVITSAISETENAFTMRAKTEKKQNILVHTPLLNSEEKVQEYRAKFQIEQEQSTLGMNLSITGFQYREITKKLTGVQLNTDSSAWRLGRFYSSVYI